MELGDALDCRTTSKRARDALSGGYIKLLNTSEFSDFTLICGDEKFKVHRAILVVGCPFFASMIRSEFMEASPGKVELRDDKPIAVRAVLDYLYSGYYIVDFGQYRTFIARVQYDASVYALAEKWDVKPLKDLVRVRFTEDAKEALRCSAAIAQFIDVVGEIYASTPEKDELRLLAASLVKQFAESMTFEERMRAGSISELKLDFSSLYLKIVANPLLPEICDGVEFKEEIRCLTCATSYCMGCEEWQ